METLGKPSCKGSLGLTTQQTAASSADISRLALPPGLVVTLACCARCAGGPVPLQPTNMFPKLKPGAYNTLGSRALWRVGFTVPCHVSQWAMQALTRAPANLTDFEIC
jgi:hypothetical protein